MESLLIVVGIVLTLIIDFAMVRVNRFLLVQNIPGCQQPPSALARGSNRIGWYCAWAGAVLMTPMLLALTFAPEGESWNWTLYPGIAGLLLLIAATLTTLPVLIGQCVRCHVGIQKALFAVIKFKMLPVLTKHGLKILAGIIIALLAAPLLPFILDVITFISYVIGFVIAARLGLLGSDSDEDDGDERTSLDGHYNYMTGKWDNGLKIGGGYLDDDEW